MGDQLVSTDYLLASLGSIWNNDVVKGRIHKTERERLFESASRILKDHDDDAWYKRTLCQGIVRANTHYKNELMLSKAYDEVFRMEPDNECSGNKAVWDLFIEAVRCKAWDKFSVRDISKKHMKRALASVTSYRWRSGNFGLGSSGSGMIAGEEITEHAMDMARLMTLDESLWNERAKSAGDLNMFHQNLTNSADKTQVQYNLTLARRNNPISMVSCGHLVIIKIGEVSEVITSVHLRRLSNLIKGFANLCVSSIFIGSKVRGMELVEEYIECIKPIINESVDDLGRAMKGAISLLAASLDKSNIMGESSYKSLLLTFDVSRREMSQSIITSFHTICPDKRALINLLSTYKMLPHPDQNMYELFNTLEGLKAPNRIDEDVEVRFRGTLRRAIFQSLSQQAYDVRLRCESGDPSGLRLVELSLSTSRKQTEMLSFSSSAWAEVKFERVFGLPDLNEFEIKASSKSSQGTCEFDDDDLMEAKEFAKTKDHSEDSGNHLFSKCKPVNDVASELKGTSRLGARNSIRRFETVIRLHEFFESKYPNTDPEDIPSEELSKFLSENPEARYLVGTEPKYGEIHKKVTRMFYMAEQELKAITQRVERYAKQISRSQNGVSITKSYEEKRHDMESFARAMTGDAGSERSVFVSFDMSEFSKKFPMKLVRIYGEILSEISGCDWIKRIDLVFRASVIIHNTRGFFSYISGVKGGFEGFLNFVWSSIHAVIMEIALESTGVDGRILTFSDDGLLMFYLSENDDVSVAREKVIKIKESYRKYGLIFHLGKTLVSTNVWEYLGDICCDNRLLPMWGKELVRVGIVVATPGLEPLYSRIQSIEGQADSLVGAGCPSIVGYIIKRYHAGCELERIASTWSSEVEEVLLIIPTTCGGFRISDPMSMSMKTSIQKDSEFLADLILLSNLDYGLAARVCAGIRMNTSRQKDVMRRIMAGSIFSCDLPDTSGMGIINKAVDIIREEHSTKVGGDPLNLEKFKNIESLVTKFVDIRLDFIANLIMSTPEWGQYTDSMALVKGRGAIRLISRKNLKLLQAEDTRNCRTAYREWHSIVHGQWETKLDIDKVVETSIRLNCPNLRLAPLKSSPRVCLTLCERDSDDVSIEVRTSHFGNDGGSLWSLVYAEPRLKTAKDVTNIRWKSEAAGQAGEKATRQMVSSVARFLAYSPESEPLVRALTNSLSYDFPVIPQAVFAGAHRRSSGSDISTSMTRVYDALSASRDTGRYAAWNRSNQRLDRTTYMECARGLVESIWLVEYISGKVDGDRVYTIKFNMDMLASSTITRPMRLEDGFIPPARALLTPMERDIAREYYTACEQYSRLADFEESMRDSEVVDPRDAELDRVAIEALQVSAMCRWFRASLAVGSSRVLPNITFPDTGVAMKRIVKRAMIETSFDSLEPDMRRRLSDDLFSASYEGEAEHLAESIEMNSLLSYLESLIEPFLILGIQGITHGDLADLRGVTNYLVNELISIISSRSLFSQGRKTVVRGSLYPVGKITPAHRATFRAAFTAGLSELMTWARSVRWNMMAITDKFRLRGPIDHTIDALIVGRMCLRESKHRREDQPYNRTSFAIRLYQLHVVRTRYVIEQAEGFRVNINEEQRLNDEEVNWGDRLIIRAYEEQGLDHRRMIRESIPKEIKYRAFKTMNIRGRYHNDSIGIAEVPMRAFIFEANFSGTIMRNAMRAVRTYPIELEEMIAREYSPSFSSIYREMVVNCDEGGILADRVVLGDMREEDREATIKLLRSHLTNIISRTASVGVTARGSRSYILGRIVGDYEVRGGVSISLNEETRETDWKVVLYRTDSAENAVNTYAKLSEDISDSISMFKVSGTRHYIIGGIITHNPRRQYINDDGEHFTNIIGGRSPSDYIPTLTVEAHASIVGSRVASATRVREVDKSDQLAYYSQRSRFISGGGQSNDISEMLQAAHETAKELGTDGVKVGGYLLMRLALMGRRDMTEDALNVVLRGFRARFGNANRQRRFDIIQDVALTHTWLKYSKISSGGSLDWGKISRYKQWASGIVFPETIPKSAISLTLSSVDELFNDDMAANAVRLAAHLYIQEPVGELEYYPEEGEEEGAEGNGLDDDLVNMLDNLF